MNHKGTAVLETERLILRPFRVEDAHSMYTNWASDSEVTRFLTWPAHGSEEVTRRLLRFWTDNYASPDCYHWAIVPKGMDGPVGDIAVVRQNEHIAEAELGYCLGRAWWGRGIMTEAGLAVVAFLRDEAGFRRICAHHDIHNPASGAVMRHLGMQREGVLRKAGFNNTGIVDVALWALVAEDEDPA